MKCQYGGFVLHFFNHVQVNIVLTATCIVSKNNGNNKLGHMLYKKVYLDERHLLTSTCTCILKLIQ